MQYSIILFLITRYGLEGELVYQPREEEEQLLFCQAGAWNKIRNGGSQKGDNHLIFKFSGQKKFINNNVKCCWQGWLCRMYHNYLQLLIL